jgi:hypothetical protein
MHIMPRKWSTNWPLANGKTAPAENSFDPAAQFLEPEMKTLMDPRQRAVDTLGNLSLLTEALNPSIGNAGWAIKREKFCQSLLRLNREVGKADDWNETAIEARAKILAKTANTKLWPSTAAALVQNLTDLAI